MIKMKELTEEGSGPQTSALIADL